MKKYQKLQECDKENRVVIFGAGSRGRLANYFCNKLGIEPLCFLDNDSNKNETIFCGKKVLLPSIDLINRADYIYIISSQMADEIKRQLLSMGAMSDRIYMFDEILQDIQTHKEKKEQVIYYPVFDSAQELTSHYYRACWYLPKENNHLEKVLFYTENCKLQSKPYYMGSSNVSVAHIIIEEDLKDFNDSLLESKIVLTWKTISEEERLDLEIKGCTVINVNTEDDEAKEYGQYCSLIWKFFKSKEEKKDILEKSYNRFCKVANHIKQRDLHVGCVFGTGPSLESSYEYDFSDCVCVVCNSIVQNRKMLDHIKPFFVTAGDVVSHLGISLYAEVFRHDLVNYLLDSNAYFFTTASFGYILTEQCPIIEDKIILVEQRLEEQNYNLLEQFALPKLDSTLNIHMLPIIHTFCDKIYINGCDGKCPDINNEDFWAHAETAQYLKLVETGHKCHPTFDRNRQKSTYSKYQDATLLSIEAGEKENGKTYFTLKKSYITALKDKAIDYDGNSQYNVDGKLCISKL